ncbi:hypothetical protein TNIN_2151 [Trichonephila inaurata madagascariensis]|uniref:Uncharacterized protein n=1 Tax=Trichonephila inaurata madagascariensis TaxID=2747483 RepID=A0A8X6MCY3_9ARAC|nr:hypothetical protein TNIN_139071 [Trichonephila inaurata madagascariensis]GFY37269.1 hypothetical protein TNIN_2151 [Trichonephila inaurata madagascariensis]
MVSSLETLISELEKNIISGMLLENASQLLPYRRRLERLGSIVKFQELLKQYPIPVKVVLNEHGFHISDWIYSREKCIEGPETCNCYYLFDEPEKYFIVKHLDQVVVWDGSVNHKDCLRKAQCQCWRKPSLYRATL